VRSLGRLRRNHPVHHGDTTAMTVGADQER